MEFGRQCGDDRLIGGRFRRSAHNRGHSSAGRAVALQASGRRFDPDWLHHFVFPADVRAAWQRGRHVQERRQHVSPAHGPVDLHLEHREEEICPRSLVPPWDWRSRRRLASPRRTRNRAASFVGLSYNFLVFLGIVHLPSHRVGLNTPDAVMGEHC
jgi:hypothetical protein